MSVLDYLRQAQDKSTVDDANAVAIEEATGIIGGRDVVQVFLACDI
jgi:hypothetical protein